MMKNLLIGALAGIFLGGAAGFAAGIFVFPYLFPPPELDETVASRADLDVVATGEFIHADPSDPVHHGAGRVTIFSRLLHLEPDFKVGPGPKYHVYLVPQADVTPDTRVQDTMFVDLGRLKAFGGGQNYPIPEGVDLTGYGTVVIWCEQFDVLISPAKLTF